MNNVEFSLTAQQILEMKAGDLMPNCFGEMKRITQIKFRGVNESSGKLFIGVEQELNKTSTMTNSFHEGVNQIFFSKKH
jgi:hypothetical protein